MWFVDGWIVGFFCGAVFIGVVLPELIEQMRINMSEFEWKYKCMSDREKAEFHKDSSDEN